MKKLILVACVLLSGCEMLGKGTKAIVSTGTLYCSLVPVEVRTIALERMQGAVEDYPEHSICDTRGFIVDIIVPTE